MPKKRNYKMPGDYSAAKESEESHQKDVCLWARQTAFLHKEDPKLSKLGFLSGSANGGKRDIRTATKLKEAGVNSGFPDLHLPVVNRMVRHNLNLIQYPSLYIEMKLAKRRNHANGGLDPDQIVWRDFLIAEGHAYALCYTWEEARDVLLAYVSQTGIYQC